MNLLLRHLKADENKDLTLAKAKFESWFKDKYPDKQFPRFISGDIVLQYSIFILFFIDCNISLSFKGNIISISIIDKKLIEPKLLTQYEAVNAYNIEIYTDITPLNSETAKEIFALAIIAGLHFLNYDLKLLSKC
jgi:hypothetical protein